MKTIKILAASLLSVFLISSTVSAGEISVTGSVKASLTTAGSGNAAAKKETGGNALSVSNDIDFNASGDLENGWSWKWQTQLDGGSIDDTQLTITLGDMGTVGLYGTEGGLNFKHGGSQMALGYGSQIGYSGDMVDPDDIGSYNNIQYHLPALPFNTTAKIGFTAGGSATSEPGDSVLGTSGSERGGVSYLVETKPIDGLAIGASYFTVEQATDVAQNGQKEENGAYYASYKMGNFGIGYSKALVAPANNLGSGSTYGLYNAYENTSYSIGAVFDNLSVSYGVEKSHRNLITDAAEYDLKIDTVQAAYTMGGMTATIGLKDIENGGYAENANSSEAHFVLSMAF